VTDTVAESPVAWMTEDIRTSQSRNVWTGLGVKTVMLSQRLLSVEAEEVVLESDPEPRSGWTETGLPIVAPLCRAAQAVLFMTSTRPSP